MLNNLKEIFPHKSPSLLEKAIDSRTEDAVNYVLLQSDTPAYDMPFKDMMLTRFCL